MKLRIVQPSPQKLHFLKCRGWSWTMTQVPEEFLKNSTLSPGNVFSQTLGLQLDHAPACLLD